MRKHQRYLPVRDAAGKLLPHFVAVANGDCDRAAVRAGNEAVLRARYEDAAFFWRPDLQTKPEIFRGALDKLAFEEKLGSMAQRADRIAAIAVALGRTVPEADPQTLSRAAELAKFDLATHMVVELTSLAGTMAREYARRSGESAAVAQALFEMELPRSAGDAMPGSVPGAVLALADRLDLLVGLFVVGANPTGSSDPFGLRRAAVGVVSLLRTMRELRPVTLDIGLAAAGEALLAQGIEVPAAKLGEAREFVVRRYEQQLLDAGTEHDLIAAVLPLAVAPAAADATLAELAGLIERDEFTELVGAIQRVQRIVPAGTPSQYDASRLTEQAELALHEAFVKIKGDNQDLATFAAVAGQLVVPIATFFDAVLVMADDPQLRAARLGLLAAIKEWAGSVLDWQAISLGARRD
ncbi:MAG TPA: glycine--tRNA ligase subunit beta, partial [Pseudonocardiaceae bacterium]|nr:glycine--tRNA ligase subunit beta [Pseudonocardiaceae bacterium]